MEENTIVEKNEKPQSLEGLHIFLRIIAVMLFLIGAYFLLTNPSTNSNSASISPGMQTFITHSIEQPNTLPVPPRDRNTLSGCRRTEQTKRTTHKLRIRITRSIRRRFPKRNHFCEIPQR